MIYFIELNDADNFNEYAHCLKLVPPAKQTQILNFKFDIDKRLSLISDLFVRYAACRSLALNNSELYFATNAYGKPFLSGSASFHYNISHTRNAIAIGFSNRPIGVDIEKIKPVDFRIANRFFNPNEFMYITKQPEQHDARFCEIWTKKEAYIKWVGKGLSLPLNGFDVTDRTLAKTLHTFKLNNYVISLCCEVNFNRTNIINLNERQASEVLFEFVNSSYKAGGN
ncbi:MAG: 4'-phosphopantetheinyl transferase superfamily protein [Defluviitaleaceae bacterium]|nr:4'-phosphopantetheinyl transferase superfamily protein [Defluviitaleaceae bacterium]